MPGRHWISWPMRIVAPIPSTFEQIFVIHLKKTYFAPFWPFGVVWSVVVWSGLVWSGHVWSGLVCCGLVNWGHFEMFWPFLPIIPNWRHFDLFWAILSQFYLFLPILSIFIHFTHFYPLSLIFGHFYPFYRFWPIWSGLVWFGLVWSGLVWSGLDWSVWAILSRLELFKPILTHYTHL